MGPGERWVTAKPRPYPDRVQECWGPRRKVGLVL